MVRKAQYTRYCAVPGSSPARAAKCMDDWHGAGPVGSERFLAFMKNKGKVGEASCFMQSSPMVSHKYTLEDRFPIAHDVRRGTGIVLECNLVACFFFLFVAVSPMKHSFSKVRPRTSASSQ